MGFFSLPGWEEYEVLVSFLDQFSNLFGGLLDFGLFSLLFVWIICWIEAACLRIFCLPDVCLWLCLSEILVSFFVILAFLSLIICVFVWFLWEVFSIYFRDCGGELYVVLLCYEFYWWIWMLTLNGWELVSVWTEDLIL